MAIDVEKEKLVAMAEAARCVLGHNVSPNTIWRWYTRGVRGVRLETIAVGVRRYTSREALLRFCAATTAAADARIVSPSTEQSSSFIPGSESRKSAREDGDALREMLQRRRRGA